MKRIIEELGGMGGQGEARKISTPSKKKKKETRKLGISYLDSTILHFKLKTASSPVFRDFKSAIT